MVRQGSPDLSLMSRARDQDYIYQYLKTFYVDSDRPTGANNMAYPQAPCRTSSPP